MHLFYAYRPDNNPDVLYFLTMRYANIARTLYYLCCDTSDLPYNHHADEQSEKIT